MDALLQIDSSIDEADKAFKYIKKGKSQQVSAKDEIDHIKSVTYSWQRNHRLHLKNIDLSVIDRIYSDILTLTSKRVSRTRYLNLFRSVKNELVDLRALAFSLPRENTGTTHDTPVFSSLASDPIMQNVLTRRWDECKKCINAEAYLAATVMMGGLLEALFVSKANSISDKSPLFQAQSAPKDSKTKETRPLKDWMLNDYINVGYEMGWITKSGKGVAAVLRDYRNYIHPEKERTNKVIIDNTDVDMFWEITKQLTKQLLSSK